MTTPTELAWHDVHHRELTAPALYEILALRNRVFVVEQDCAYLDVDGLDLAQDTRHLYAVPAALPGSEPVAYARLLGPDFDHDAARIGRVIVSSDRRGQRLGQELLTRALASCLGHWPDAPVGLAAQAHLQEFYGRAGFVPVSEPYDEDGIPHIDMAHRPA